ncbi:MAG TPA: HEAT repeat domain-containing protein [Planctomycetota bacterium]|nr:HEAT repeat domain-containing protein [Planctomycetota bacterium]
MKGGGTERRKYPRYKPEPGTIILCTREEASGATGANLVQRVIDVSGLGVCFVATAPMVEGSGVNVDIMLPGQKAKITTRGKVRWTQFLESRGREAHVAGIEFELLVEGLGARGSDSAILDIFLTLRVSVAQLRLYPKDSPQVLKVITDTYHSIHSFLELANTLTLSKTPRGLLVNGRPLPERGTVSDSLETATLGLLSDAAVKSITFRKGLTLDELITFLHALTKKFWDVKDGKEINRRLRDERVNQISVDEVQYVAIGEGDIVIEDAARKLAGGETELAKLLANLEQLIDSASNEGLGSEARLHLMKKLVEQDPNLLKQASSLGAAGAGGGTGGGGAGDGIDLGEEGKLSFEQARGALGELARLLKEAPPELHAPLRTVGKVFVDAFKHNPRLASLMVTILSAQAVDSLPESGKGGEAPKAQESAAVARVRVILQLNDDDRVHALAQEGNALLDELGALHEGELMRTMLGSLSGILLDRAARKRLSVARTMNTLRRGLERAGTADVEDAFEQAVRTAIDVERDASVYSVLADMTAFIADLRIRRGKIERAREILELLHRHYQIKDALFPQRGELAYIALERVASGVGFASLSERVRAGDPESTRIIEALDAAATRFLIREIKNAETPARRMHFAQFISRAGAGAATVLMDELGKTSVPSDVMHLIEVMPTAMPADMAEMALGGLLRHATVAVRRRSATMLSEQTYPRAGGLLLDSLGAEGDPQTRTIFIECLGRLRFRGAVDALNKFVDERQQPEEVRCAACAALGRIGDVRAVPVLAKLYYKGEKGLTKVFRSVPSSVRAAAARALAAFPTHKEAREALRAAKDDHDPTVRAVANQALYAPLQDAFGERALGVQVVSTADQLTTGMKAGGVLQEIGIEPLCTRLATLESNGLLSLNFNGPSAKIWFDAGLIVAAEFEGRRDHEAFIFMAGKREGYILFQPNERAPERRMLSQVASLMQELARSRVGPSGRTGSDSSIRPPG